MEKKTKWKKLDSRIKILLENGLQDGYRSMFVIVGDKGKDQVPILHHIQSKAAVRARPSVLWCYKKELGFTTHRKKLMRQLQKKQKAGKLDVNEDNPFELFVCATDIRWCYYNETHKILGNTFGMCVLQDFEALTPNILARTMETVEGGGVIVLLLNSVDSLQQLYAMSMDVHSRYRTEAHQDVVGRFNERFILSLTNCERCLVLDDRLTVLPLSEKVLAGIQPRPPKSLSEITSPSQQKLKALKESMLTDPDSDQRFTKLVSLCKTLDQAEALLAFLEAMTGEYLLKTVVMTAARGRGKSAALGLAMAAAVAKGLSNIYVTAPSPENLTTMMDFVQKGLQAMDFELHTDFTVTQSTEAEYNKAVVKICVRVREHRHNIQYIKPQEASRLGSAELVCIDEAAAIPLPLVKSLLGSYLVFMSSTVNGYEGTGRSLSMKLVHGLRTDAATASSGRKLKELSLTESIRYSPGDLIETWLSDLLCLDCSDVKPLRSGCPSPQQCQLYYVNRDTLFSYHKFTEAFLQRLMSLYVASHYKNSPNDLQMLSDAPAHHIFVLLGPFNPAKAELPEILSVVQLCFEGEINKDSVMRALGQGKRPSGDLIPWTVSQQFSDNDFPTLSGARVIRIATHPDYQSMGYGSRALQLLTEYFEGKFPLVDTPDLQSMVVPDLGSESSLRTEQLKPKNRAQLPPLLSALPERKPECLDYLGVSFGMTCSLIRFWKKAGFVPVYLRQTASDLTGEHSCIMLKPLHTHTAPPPSWASEYFQDFRRRFLYLLSFTAIRTFPSQFALEVVRNKTGESLAADELHRVHMDRVLTSFTPYDLKRLAQYAKNQADYHLIMDLLTPLALVYFSRDVGDLKFSTIQQVILVGLGLQHKTVDSLAADLEMPANQILGLFNRMMRKAEHFLRDVFEGKLAEEMKHVTAISKLAVHSRDALEAELGAAADEIEAQRKKQLEALLCEDYIIKDKKVEEINLPTLNRVKPKRGQEDSNHQNKKHQPKKKKFKKSRN